jgi:dihydrofolate reductase
MISLIAAVSDNNVIGYHRELPWRLPADMKYFVEKTLGNTIVIGRTTFELIIAAHAGKLLKNRKNVVLTTKPDYSYPGVLVIHGIDELKSLKGEVMVIGGAKVYEATITMADRLYITEVHTVVEGEAHFTPIDPNSWRETSRQSHLADESNQYDYDFVVYDRA